MIHLRIAEVEIGHGRALAQQPLSVEAGLRRFNGDVQQLRQRLRKPRLIRLTAGKNGAGQLCVGGHGGKIVKHDAHFIQIVLLGIAPLQQTLQLHLPVVDEGQQQQLALRVQIEAGALIRVRTGGRRVLGGGEAGANGGSMAVTAEIYGGHAQSHAVGKGVIAVQHRPGRGPELHPQKLRAIVLLRTQRLPRKLIFARIDGEIFVHIRQQHLAQTLLLLHHGYRDGLADDLGGAKRKDHLTAAAEQPLPQNRLHRVPQSVQPHELTVLHRVGRRGQNDLLLDRVASQHHLGNADLPLGDLHHQRSAAQFDIAHIAPLPDCGNGTAVQQTVLPLPQALVFSCGQAAPALFSVLQTKKAKIRPDEPVAHQRRDPDTGGKIRSERQLPARAPHHADRMDDRA